MKEISSLLTYKETCIYEKRPISEVSMSQLVISWVRGYRSVLTYKETYVL